MGQTALYIAIAHNKSKIGQVLLNKGIDLDVVDELDMTALHYAQALQRT